LKVDEGKNKKRTKETGSQTPVPTKKAKYATPEKTGNVITHTALYYSIRVVNGNTFSIYTIKLIWKAYWNKLKNAYRCLFLEANETHQVLK